MGGQGAAKISNTEQLIEKLLGFQDQLNQSMEVLNSVPITVKGQSVEMPAEPEEVKEKPLPKEQF